ncbi:hypothetical protein ACXDF8_04445 [Mycolicibacterium sp. CBM1]
MAIEVHQRQLAEQLLAQAKEQGNGLVGVPTPHDAEIVLSARTQLNN